MFLKSWVVQRQLLQQGDIAKAKGEYRKKNFDCGFQKHRCSYRTFLCIAFGKRIFQSRLYVDRSAGSGQRVRTESNHKEVFFRRALVALEEKSFDKVKVLGQKSELPQGFLLVAEIQIIDGEYQEAESNLNKVLQTGEPALQKLASSYLDDLSSDDRQMIAEAQARWALGDRKIFVKVVKKPLLSYIANVSKKIP